MSQGAAETHPYHSGPNKSTGYDTDFIRFRNVSRVILKSKRPENSLNPRTAALIGSKSHNSFCKIRRTEIPDPGFDMKVRQDLSATRVSANQSSQTGDQKPTGHERHLSSSSVYPSPELCSGFHKMAGRNSRSGEIV
jgi:hypothetical protein